MIHMGWIMWCSNRRNKMETSVNMDHIIHAADGLVRQPKINTLICGNLCTWILVQIWSQMFIYGQIVSAIIGRY